MRLHVCVLKQQIHTVPQQLKGYSLKLKMQQCQSIVGIAFFKATDSADVLQPGLTTRQELSFNRDCKLNAVFEFFAVQNYKTLRRAHCAMILIYIYINCESFGKQPPLIWFRIKSKYSKQYFPVVARNPPRRLFGMCFLVRIKSAYLSAAVGTHQVSAAHIAPCCCVIMPTLQVRLG